jgi:hypothetical protein
MLTIIQIQVNGRRIEISFVAQEDGITFASLFNYATRLSLLFPWVDT